MAKIGACTLERNALFAIALKVSLFSGDYMIGSAETLHGHSELS